MALSMSELAGARELAASLLEDLGLEAYLFEVEPRDEHWELVVECAVAQGWETVRLVVDRRALNDARDDPDHRRRLLQEWGTRLAACRREP
ncbi:MAG: hypothetical protein GWO39_09375 [Gammaproteobacteria bacterium]|nr:hypothetical protein [Gammaproteobacteria bacterium]NIT63975.1 hypothetical protein [Gammaproteobacteria bacterium]NIV19135.1 hypothetical protein [Gammaproteobacteria bacterium]NIY32555.1 hypothetical protein [Gammaproteobacteria bacterium]